jgi:hypothetical protein
VGVVVKRVGVIKMVRSGDWEQVNVVEVGSDGRDDHTQKKKQAEDSQINSRCKVRAWLHDGIEHCAHV